MAAWLWFDRDRISEGERKKRENNVFTAWRREDLSRVEIAHEGETIVLTRDARADGVWRMTSPLVERVDQGAAERLLTTFEFATVARKVGSDTSGLGFDRPRATGAITMGALVFHFTLGGASPRPEGSGYLKVDDGEPFVASRELTDALLAPADTYRDRSVIPYLSLDLARFEVKHPGGGFAVERSDERSFKVTGERVFASRAALDKVWAALAEMRAEAFPKDADADRLTANPRLTITMTATDPAKPPSQLVAGDACPGQPNDIVILRKTPTRVAACAPKGAVDALLAVTPASLVDRKPFSFRHDEIEEYRVERLDDEKPRAIEVARRGPGFHLREPEDRELTTAEADAMGEMLSLLEQDTASEVHPGGEPFTATARARVRAGNHEETVEVGALGGKTVVVRRVRDDARLTVSPAAARRLVPRMTMMKPRTLLAETRSVKRVVLRCGVPQELVDEGAGLKLVEPRGYETDGSIQQLVDGLLRGRVLIWAADRDDGSFGFKEGKDDCRVVVAFTDGNSPATVRFGADGEGGVYGLIDGKPEVFVAPLGLITLVRRIYVSHAALRVDPSSVESVKLNVKTSQPPDALRDAVGRLYADHAISLGSTDVGKPDIEITIQRAEGGPPKRVTCGPLITAESGTWRHCATPDVKAVFEVRASAIDAFTSPPDAGKK
jgi:hypothetical protein